MANRNKNLLEEFIPTEIGIDDEREEIIPVINEEDESSFDENEVPDMLPILPLRNTVLFPGVIIPISVGREKSIKLVKEAYRKGSIIGVVSQKSPDVDEPSREDMNTIGTYARVLKMLSMPDDSTSIIIQGKKRFALGEIVSHDPYMLAIVESVNEVMPIKKRKEFAAIISSLKDLSVQIIQLSTNIPPEAAIAVKNIESNSFLINFICSNSDIEVKEKQRLLEMNDMKKRSLYLLEFLTKQLQELQLKDDIQSKVKNELDQQQREYILNQQLKTIKSELGADSVDKEVEALKRRAKNKKWSKEVAKAFQKELSRIEHMHPASPDYSNQLTYLQTLLELPWDECTKDIFDLKRASRILDRDHYGLDKVKDRILEHLAVLKLKGDLKAPILCLVGPPGVGKTSLGKSIAQALKRKYVRMSLGGLHDEAEIRGHRKTYIGAMPGRIIQNLKKIKSSNPVFVLDEIDKVGNDFRGDPSFALLEVLDPEQNSAFYDNYLELEYDLSKVLFIATANTLEPISSALRDRMEIINVTGYIVEEKVEIAKRHLIPKLLKEHGMTKNDLKFPKRVLERIIEDYTRESGVRQLEKRLAKMIRKTAKKIGMGNDYRKSLTIADINEMLGHPKYIKNTYEGNDYAGVVTGLAWTAAGGQILYIETSLSHGSGKLALTGNLGQVMKESATIALEYIKAHADELGIPKSVFDNWNIHVHIPEGAIPKDGPSAGITMISALASALTQRKIRDRIAMTGEITLRGKILPVGGIKEKILAAKRARINDIILPKDNEKDIFGEIKDIYIEGLKFHFFDDIIEVLNYVLLPEKVKNAKQLHGKTNQKK